MRGKGLSKPVAAEILSLVFLPPMVWKMLPTLHMAGLSLKVCAGLS
jgi:hypothetical protein